MCVIICCDTNYPKLAILKSAEKINTHGGSIAWIDGKKVRWEKGINADQIFKITKTIKLPFIIHFRIATEGGICNELCHPFPINYNVDLRLKGIANEVLFHNGIWDEYKEYCLKVIFNHKLKFPVGKMSDSRALTWLVYHFGKQILNLIGDSNNKIAILTPKGIKKYGSGWVDVKKVKCSNNYFEHYTIVNHTAFSDEYSDEDDLYYFDGELSEFYKDECEYLEEEEKYLSPSGEILYTYEQLQKYDKNEVSEDLNNLPYTKMSAKEYDEIYYENQRNISRYI